MSITGGSGMRDMPDLVLPDGTYDIEGIQQWFADCLEDSPVVDRLGSSYVPHNNPQRPTRDKIECTVEEFMEVFGL